MKRLFLALFYMISFSVGEALSQVDSLHDLPFELTLSDGKISFRLPELGPRYQVFEVGSSYTSVYGQTIAVDTGRAVQLMGRKSAYTIASAAFLKSFKENDASIILDGAIGGDERSYIVVYRVDLRSVGGGLVETGFRVQPMTEGEEIVAKGLSGCRKSVRLKGGIACRLTDDQVNFVAQLMRDDVAEQL